MKTIQICLLTALFYALFASSTYASPPAPTPICSISGVINNVEYDDAYVAPCVNEPYGCPTDMQTSFPAQYTIYIQINSVSFVEGNTYFANCEDIYPVGKIVPVILGTTELNNGVEPQANQEIEAEVRSFGNSYFNSYKIIDSSTTSTGIETSDISNTLISNNTVSSVIGIIEQEDKQTYKVTAYKTGKLLFLIPVNVEYEIIVSAKDGEIQTISKPWWNFLLVY